MDELLTHFQLPTPEDEYDEQLLTDVERTGWHNVHVDGDESGPDFSFTVGLFYKYQHPEILVMGLSHEVADGLLNVAAAKVVAGTVFEAVEPVDDIADGFPVTFIPISLNYYRDYLGYASWFYGALPQAYPAIQLIWPDKDGLFPWEDGYDTRFFDLQQVLIDTDEEE